MKGGLLLSMPESSGNEAETCFTQSLELSRTRALAPGNCALAVDLAADSDEAARV